jgi:ABC-type spermidine/putrescine transport system permease subunit I
MTRRLAPYLLSAPAAGLLLGLLAGPLVFLVRVSLYEPARGSGFFRPGTWTLANFAAVADGYGLKLLGFTVLFGAAVAGLTVILAYPLALFVRALRPFWRRAAVTAVLLPKLASVLVILFGLQRLLGSAGPVNRVLLAAGVVDEPVALVRNLFGAVLGEAYLIVPYAVLILLVQLLGIDPGLEAAARGLGATPRQTAARVTLPLLRPALLAGATAAFVGSLNEAMLTLFLATPATETLPAVVWPQLRYAASPLVAVASCVSVAATLSGVGILLVIFRRRGGAGSARAWPVSGHVPARKSL